jgi:hydroxymethylpyrimidine/phosphomethylpyrimidine kinase
MSSSPPAVLAFAASDPTGGAGVQADLLTIAALGCHPLTVLTALTVQDTHGVESLHAVEARLVEAQARRLFDELPVAACKLGVLGSPDNARAIARLLGARPRAPLVVDPVLASGRGDTLSSDAGIAALEEGLLPLATVVTPNRHEAERLGGVARLLEHGCRYVLLTGTHASTPDVVNILYDRGGVVREDRWPRLPGSYHGSGCTLASALAALLALGRDVPSAAREAQEFTWRALEAGFRPGDGQFIPQRLFGR